MYETATNDAEGAGSCGASGPQSGAAGGGGSGFWCEGTGSGAGQGWTGG